MEGVHGDRQAWACALSPQNARAVLYSTRPCIRASLAQPEFHSSLPAVSTARQWSSSRTKKLQQQPLTRCTKKSHSVLNCCSPTTRDPVLHRVGTQTALLLRQTVVLACTRQRRVYFRAAAPGDRRRRRCREGRQAPGHAHIRFLTFVVQKAFYLRAYAVINPTRSGRRPLRPS